MSMYGRQAVKGILHTDGTWFVNGDGERIILEGYGTGNWLNPEGFMIGAPEMDFSQAALGEVFGGGITKDGKRKLVQPDRFDRHRTVESVVRELCGSDYLKTFWQRWYDNHLAEEDIAWMAEQDMNCVRLVLNAEVFLREEPGLQWIEEGFERLGRVLDWCEKYRIYAILDLHAAPGGQAGCLFDDGYDMMPRVFYDQECFDRGVALWAELAKRFGDRWIVGGYDLLNEPISIYPADKDMVPRLAEFYDACIREIRKVDKVHMFALEGPFFARDNVIFDHEYDPGFHNWCINWHRYSPSPELREMTPYILKSREWDVPVWISEGGGTDANNEVFFNMAKDFGMGWSLWCYKTQYAPYRRTGELNCVHYKLPAEWDLVKEYCRGGSKPSYEKAIEIFDEYLENLKFANCVKNPDRFRKARRTAPYTLPAVGYDLGFGKSFSGDWDLGNLLDYRLEDHTKLVYDKMKREPVIWLDDMRVEPKHDPLTDLYLEMHEGQFACYTLRITPENTKLALTGIGLTDALVEVHFGDEVIGSIAFAAGTECAPGEGAVCVPACEEGLICLKVLKGTVQLKELIYTVEA